jgi:hypothetical protein
MRRLPWRIATVVALALAVNACNDESLSKSPGQGGSDEGVTIETVTPSPRASGLLLPDLETLPPYDLHYSYSAGGALVLRFATTITNGGDGPLELLGVYDPRGNRTTAIQRIVKVDGTLQEHIAGSFVFHPGHKHWHFEDFTIFELWSYRPDGSLDTLLTSTGKITFCIFDSELMNPPFKGAALKPAFGDCDNDSQGISLGWADTYGSSVPGQELDISNVPEGRYAIRSLADPDNRIIEIDDTNNEVIIFVELTESDIIVLDGP